MCTGSWQYQLSVSLIMHDKSARACGDKDEHSWLTMTT